MFDPKDTAAGQLSLSIQHLITAMTDMTNGRESAMEEELDQAQEHLHEAIEILNRKASAGSV